MKTTNPSAGRSAVVAAILVLALSLVPAALAGKGNGGGGKSGSTSSLAGPVMVVDNNGDGLPNHFDSITFNVSTTATDRPQVGLRCYQNGVQIYDGYVGYWAGYMFTPYFTLDSGYWVAGVTANCDARLFYNDNRGRQIVLATLSFSVAP